jgi:hypothetical protein
MLNSKLRILALLGVVIFVVASGCSRIEGIEMVTETMGATPSIVPTLGTASLTAQSNGVTTPTTRAGTSTVPVGKWDSFPQGEYVLYVRGNLQTGRHELFALQIKDSENLFVADLGRAGRFGDLQTDPLLLAFTSYPVSGQNVSQLALFEFDTGIATALGWTSGCSDPSWLSKSKILASCETVVNGEKEVSLALIDIALQTLEFAIRPKEPYQLMSNPRVSPDKQWIAYQGDVPGQIRHPSSGVYVVPEDCISSDKDCPIEFNQHFQTAGTGLAWSPSGNELAFGDTASIGIIDIESGTLSRIEVPGTAIALAWSPLGTELAVTVRSESSLRAPIISIDLASQSQREMVSGQVEFYVMGWAQK